jgi:hypothetical protein
MLVGPYRPDSVLMMPIVDERRVTSARAAVLGR